MKKREDPERSGGEVYDGKEAQNLPSEVCPKGRKKKWRKERM